MDLEHATAQTREARPTRSFRSNPIPSLSAGRMAQLLASGWVFEAGGLRVVASRSCTAPATLALWGPNGMARVLMDWDAFMALVHADDGGSDLCDEAVLTAFLRRVFDNPLAYGARRAM
jgi:hypothetical protein